MINPGLYRWNYISAAQSKYHVWFQTMGYPELDIMQYPSGEWDIIQYYNAPIIPSMTRWQMVLGPMRNQEITYGFCAKYIQQLDIQKRAFWAREEAKTKAVLDEGEKGDKRAVEFADRATKAVMKNPELVKRIAKNGLKEIDLRYLSRRIPQHELIKPIKGEKINVPSTSKPTVETVHEGVSGPVHGKTGSGV